MAGRYPKPDAERRNHAQPAFGWTELPAEGRKGAPPDLPARGSVFVDGEELDVDWHEATLEEWARLWRSPQATQWAADGSSLSRWARLHDDLVRNVGTASSVSAEMRQIEDRHGLSPKAMLQLRWRVAAEGAAVAKPPPAKRPTRARNAKSAAVLKLLGDAAAG